jgi:hypothetical protein
MLRRFVLVLAVGGAIVAMAEAGKWWEEPIVDSFRNCSDCPEMIMAPADSFIKGRGKWVKLLLETLG